LSSASVGLFDDSVMRRAFCTQCGMAGHFNELPPCGHLGAYEAKPDISAEGWLYIKADYTVSARAKFGMTDGKLADRLTETGNPSLVVHWAHHFPLELLGALGMPSLWHLEQRILDSLPRSAHAASGHLSEFIDASASSVVTQVGRLLAGMVAYADYRDTHSQKLTFEPNYDPARVRKILGDQMLTDYWIDTVRGSDPAFADELKQERSARAAHPGLGYSSAVTRLRPTRKIFKA